MSKRNRHKNKKAPKPNKIGGGATLLDRVGKDVFDKLRKNLNNEKDIKEIHKKRKD